MTDAVDLIVPARNEEDNVPALFKALPGHLFRHIILVDNGSTDRTAELARSCGAVVISEPQRGYGSACLAGLTWIAQQASQSGAEPISQGAVAFLDADLADDPASLPRLIEPVLAGKADMAIGIRPALAQPGALDPHQRFGNALACCLMWPMVGRRFQDLGPMRVVSWKSLQGLAMRDRTWGWIVEMNFKAARQGLAIVEIDVPYRKRHAGKSKISGSLVGSARAGVKILTTLAQLWWHRKSLAMPDPSVSRE